MPRSATCSSGRPASTRSSTPRRTGSRPSRSTSTPAPGRSPAPTSSAARCRRPRRSASRSSSTRRSTTIRRRAGVSSRWWRRARPRRSLLPATIGSLRFAVKGRELAASDRKPAVLTFVVDVSGSMAQENRLGLVKQALGLLLDELAWEDRVALVVYGTRAASVVLEHTSDHRADPPRHRLAATRRVDQRRGGTAPRLRPRRRGLPAGLEQPRRALLGWRRQRRRHRTGVDPGADRPRGAARHRAHHRRLRHGQLQRRADGAARRPGRRPLPLRRHGGGGAAHLRGGASRARSRRSRRTPRSRSSSIRRRWSGGGCSATRTATSPTATSATTGSTPARSAPATRRPRSTRSGSPRAPGATTPSARCGCAGRASPPAASRKPRSPFACAISTPRSPMLRDNLRRAAVAAELAEMLKRSFYAKEASWRPLRAEVARLERPTGAERQPDDLRTMILRAAELSAGAGRSDRGAREVMRRRPASVARRGRRHRDHPGRELALPRVVDRLGEHARRLLRCMEPHRVLRRHEVEPPLRLPMQRQDR